MVSTGSRRVCRAPLAGLEGLDSLQEAAEFGLSRLNSRPCRDLVETLSPTTQCLQGLLARWP